MALVGEWLRRIQYLLHRGRIEAALEEESWSLEKGDALLAETKAFVAAIRDDTPCEVSGGYFRVDGPRITVDTAFPNVDGRGLNLLGRAKVNLPDTVKHHRIADWTRQRSD